MGDRNSFLLETGDLKLETAGSIRRTKKGAARILAQVVEQARAQNLTSDEHFTVDGTLLEAWAGAKSFRRKDGKKPPPGDDDAGNPTVNFHGEKRSNRTHASSTDPEAQMAQA